MRAPSSAVFGVLFLVASSAGADGINVQEADRRFDEGKKLFLEGKYADAHVKFLEACAAHTTLRCPKNLAAAEIVLGRHVDAAQNLREYLRDPESRTDEQIVSLRDGYMEELGKVGQLRIFAPYGATVRVDDKVVGKSPFALSLFVEPGHRKIRANLGEDELVKEVDVKAGEVVDIDLRPAGDTTAGPSKTDPALITPPPPATETYRPMVGYVVPAVLAGLGLVGIGMGVGFAVSRQGAASDRDALLMSGVCANATSASCAAYTDRVDAVNADTTAAIVGYVVGGVLLAASVAAYLIWPKATRVVVVAPNGLGLSLVGTF